MDSTGRRGVVTTQSLAVELQAGGLTQEHVEYVCGECSPAQHVHACGVDQKCMVGVVHS